MLRSVIRRQQRRTPVQTVPGGRGRLYAPPSPPAGGIAAADAHGVATITARVYRAETDTWEDVGVLVEDIPRSALPVELLQEK